MEDSSTCPAHVAIIMDGNGRWATDKGLPRTIGHEKGVEALRRTVEACRNTELTTLSVYSFSTENWSRPASEVSALMGLLKLYVKQDLKKLKTEGVRVRIIGSRKGLPKDISDLIELTERDTADNKGFNLNIAFNYGAQDEIVEACKAIAQKVSGDEIKSEEIDKTLFEKHLWFSSSPAPDLLIRTSGECRISNFMLWQLAYSELVFLDCYWPDFGEAQLNEALDIYQNRNRRFGALDTKK